MLTVEENETRYPGRSRYAARQAVPALLVAGLSVEGIARTGWSTDPRSASGREPDRVPRQRKQGRGWWMPIVRIRRAASVLRPQ